MKTNKQNIFLFALILLCSCTNNKKQLECLIHGDSIQYWDLVIYSEGKQKPLETDCFRNDGTFISYDIDNDGNRRVMTFGNGDIAIQTWSISEDSIFTYNIGKSKIIKYNKDTIFFGGIGKGNILIRVKEKMKIINLGDSGDTIRTFKSLGLP